jgi:putative transposase
MDETGRYFVSLQVGSSEPFHKPFARTGKALGVDVNIENFCTDSEGVVTDNPKFLDILPRLKPWAFLPNFCNVWPTHW